ncbi:MAG: hypothetical protein IT350_13190 [Deltaproteobacteria bacterium]|nr:hypothetical protein [Deltaproteobacteria bacterium]
MSCRHHAVLIVGMIVVFFAATTACFDADKEPPEEDIPADDDTGGDDDASGNDDADDDDDDDDDSDDDDDTDDDADDDSDDDADDDTGPPEVSCPDIMEAVYEVCDGAFAEKIGGERLDKTEALAVCEDGDEFWSCVGNCVPLDGGCVVLFECINDDCAGPWLAETLP